CGVPDVVMPVRTRRERGDIAQRAVKRKGTGSLTAATALSARQPRRARPGVEPRVPTGATPMVRRLALLLAALAGLCLAAPAAAELVRIDIVDRDTGRWLPVHRHRHEQ